MERKYFYGEINNLWVAAEIAVVETETEMVDNIPLCMRAVCER